MKTAKKTFLESINIFMILCAAYFVYSFYEYNTVSPKLKMNNIHITRDGAQVPLEYDNSGNLIIKAKDKIVIVYDTNEFDEGNFLIESIYRDPTGAEFQINHLFKSIRTDRVERLKNFIIELNIPAIIKPHCQGELYGRMSYSNDTNIFFMFKPKNLNTQKVSVCIVE